MALSWKMPPIWAFLQSWNLSFILCRFRQDLFMLPCPTTGLSFYLFTQPIASSSQNSRNLSNSHNSMHLTQLGATHISCATNSLQCNVTKVNGSVPLVSLHSQFYLLKCNSFLDVQATRQNKLLQIASIHDQYNSVQLAASHASKKNGNQSSQKTWQYM